MASELDPELAHLAPSFDANSLTIPKLRGILVQHDVSYPASAKKGQLVDIFNEQVAPQGPKILRDRAKVKRSTRGIEYVPSSQESVVDEEEILTKTPRRISRKSTNHEAVAADEDATSAPISTAKRGRSTLAKVAKASEKSAEETMLATKTPVSASNAPVRQERDDESPFSAHNPFQSGSSPLSGSRSRSGERRRKTTGSTDIKSGKRATSSRRKTDFPITPQSGNGAITTFSQNVAVPVSDVKHARKVKAADNVQAGEEFTAEETQALAQDESHALRRTRRIKPSADRPRSLLSSAIWSILFVMLTTVAFIWREEKLRVGFCGIGQASETFGGAELPEVLDSLRPQCEPCPQHASCYQRLEIMCEPGFVLTQHPLALGGLAPLPPTCEPDGERARKVKAVADRALEELRERNARFECGELRDNKGKLMASAEVSESELKQKVARAKKRGMSNEEFEDIWGPALGDLTSRTEVISGSDGKSGQQTLRSNSLARISLACAARRSIRLAVARNLWKLGALIAILGLAGYARSAVSNARSMEARAKQLASVALNRLATQATLHVQDGDRFPESWISMSQLRDDVLRDEFSAKRRQKLWVRVQKKVEDNSNVRPMIREIKSGEVARVWEWIGVLSEEEKGKRVSFGSGLKPLQTEYWDDRNRPIY